MWLDMERIIRAEVYVVFFQAAHDGIAMPLFP